MDSELQQEIERHPEHQRRLAQAVMRRQVNLSLKIAVVFVIMLAGLPLVNRYMPELANKPVGGFTLTWLFLAVLFYPITWALSWWFIRQSNRIEEELAKSLKHEHLADSPNGEAR